ESQIAARPAVPICLRGGSDRARHRQGTDAHRRRAAHVALSDVFLLRQGQTRIGIHRALLSRRPERRPCLVRRHWVSPMIVGALFGFLPLVIWLYLLLARRGFWLLRERDPMPVAEPAQWPAVTAVVPARNEADVIQRSIGSLLAQDYPGEFRVVLVDD